jgi:hypothetical protein
MTNSEWKLVRQSVIDILEAIEPSETGERCFISAYQIAVLLVKNNNGNLPIAGLGIGGKGEGVRKSLSQQVANKLSVAFSKNSILNLEMRFFSTDGLEQFSFRNEKGLLREPSKANFSMFRITK